MWQAGNCKKRKGLWKDWLWFSGQTVDLLSDAQHPTFFTLQPTSDQPDDNSSLQSVAVQASLQAPRHHSVSMCISVLVLFIYVSGCVAVDGQL